MDCGLKGGVLLIRFEPGQPGPAFFFRVYFRRLLPWWIALFLHIYLYDKMLAMKEKDASSEREEQAAEERQPGNPTIHTRTHQDHRNDKQEEKKMHAGHMHERARKSYHNDGPGGNYDGF